jgi:hypothetical protein
MYKQVCNKYLPVIRILIKRSLSADQTLNLNATDFERASAGRKAGYKFSMGFSNGRLSSTVSTSPVAKDLQETLLQDELIKDCFKQNDYLVEMTPKFLLTIKALPNPAAGTQAAETDTAVLQATEK